VNLLHDVTNIGVDQNLDGFRAQRIRNYNTTLLVFVVGYIVYIGMGTWQGLWESVAILSGFTALLGLCFYFGSNVRQTKLGIRPNFIWAEF